MQALVRRQRLCPFCHGQDHHVVARKYRVVRIRRCDRCCLYFTDPIYRSCMANLYDSRLYRAEGSTTTAPDAGALSALKTSMFTASDKNCRSQIQALIRLGAGGRLLEVGSSWGYFLYQAQAAGFTAMGVEPNALRRDYGVRELGVDIRSSIEDVPEGEFDVIYSAHTLEHISEPNLFFSECHRRLRTGGLLAIEVPHFDWDVRGTRALSIIGAVHPLGLSRSFFQVALPASGFKCVGLYDEWTRVPSQSLSAPDDGILIAIAEKVSTPPSTLQ